MTIEGAHFYSKSKNYIHHVAMEILNLITKRFPIYSIRLSFTKGILLSILLLFIWFCRILITYFTKDGLFERKIDRNDIKIDAVAIPTILFSAHS